MTIADKYRFWVDFPATGFIQVYPKNAEIVWVDRKQDQFRFFQRTLDTPLIFEDRPKDGITDFTRFANLERQDLTCTKLKFRVDKYCDCDSTWTTEWWMGYFRLSDGEWDFSNCQLKIKANPDDLYTCLLENWKDDYNLFDYGDPVETISAFSGEIQTMCCTKTIPAGSYSGGYADECLPDPTTWAITAHGLCVPAFGAQKKLKTCWAREYVVGGSQPPGDGWVQVDGTNWARPVPTQLEAVYDMYTPEGIQAILTFFGGICVEGSFLYQYEIVGVQDDGTTGFDNAKNLNSVLVDLFSEIGCGSLTLVSNFLGINPDATAPSNKYYTQAAIDAQDLRLLDASDVAVVGETQSATTMTASLLDIFTGLQVLFNLDMTIIGTTLYLEHKSYFESDPSSFRLNLTVEPFVNWITDKWKYTYQQENHPKFERFYAAAETDGEGSDFDGVPITYDNICVNDRKEPVEKVFRTDIFLTNIGAIVGDEDYFDSKLICLVSMNNGVISTKTGILNTGLLLFNGAIAFSYLHQNYHDYARPFRKGFINNVETMMARAQKNRKQVRIGIPMDCNDYMNEFNVLHPVRTQMGWGEILEDRYLEPQEILELTLLHT